MQDPRESLPTARLISLCLPLILLIVALVAPVDAKTATRRVEVPYTDLDLTLETDRAKLDQRLARAIRDVCRVPFSRSVRSATEARACFEAKREEFSIVRDRMVAAAMDSASRVGNGPPGQ